MVKLGSRRAFPFGDDEPDDEGEEMTLEELEDSLLDKEEEDLIYDQDEAEGRGDENLDSDGADWRGVIH